MKKVIILCGGGHGKCVIDAMRLGGKYSPHCVLDFKERVGQKVLGVKITGTEADLPSYFKRGIKLCFLALGSTGDPSRRIAMWKLAEAAGFDFPPIIHPSSVVSKDATIGRGVYVGPGAVINSGASIGEGCIINSSAIVEHDCRIGAFVHIAPGAVLSGGVIVGDRSHLGTGCSVMHRIKIGEDSVIGVGSAVVKDVPARTVCFGNPARKIKSR